MLDDSTKEKQEEQKFTVPHRFARNCSTIYEPKKRQLYQMMVRQLLHDGYTEAAEAVSRNSMVLVPNAHLNGNQLSQLVEDGLFINLLRAKDIGEYQAVNRVERYVDASALYVPVPALHPGRMVMKERFATTPLGGVIRCVSTSGCGDLVACGGSGGVGTRIFSRCAFENELLVASAVDVSDWSTAELTATTVSQARAFSDHTDATETVAFSPNGDALLASGGHDGQLLLYNFSSPKTQVVLRHADAYPIRHASFHPSGSHVLFAVDHNVPRLLSLADGKLLAPSSSRSQVGGSGSTGGLSSTSTSTGSSSSSSTGSSSTGGASGSSQHQGYHVAAVSHCCFSPNGRLFATCGFDGVFIIYDGNSSRPVFSKPSAHSDTPVTSVVFSRSSQTVLTCGCDSVSRLWDLRKLTDECASFGLPKKTERRLKASFNSAESHVWMQDADLNLTCHDIYSAAAVSTIVQRSQSFCTAPFDGAIISGGIDGRLKLWSPSAIATF